MEYFRIIEKVRILSNHISGIESLAVDAVIGVTNIVEHMHHTINSLAFLNGHPKIKTTSGITGFVYKSIRVSTKIVGKFFEKNKEMELGETSLKLESFIAVLNGVLGDHLVSKNNPLAIQMKFRDKGKVLQTEQIIEKINHSSKKIVIMIHGSCMNDLSWEKNGHNHGLRLEKDLGLTPFYIHYNSGLHIFENGKKFTNLIETIMSQVDKKVEITIVAHSMGGLVTQSACFYAKQENHQWINSLKKIVFLGTPHHGSILEKGGNILDFLLNISPYSAPIGNLGKIRSCGVTDLRYGNITQEDSQNMERFKLTSIKKNSIPLPEGIKCYAIGVTTNKSKNKLVENTIGDGLVTLDSALGVHKNPLLNLNFPQSRLWIGYGMNHMDLLDNFLVYETIKSWIKNTPPTLVCHDEVRDYF
jgi:PGAP1-like protein